MTPETLNAGMNAGIVPGNLGGYLSLLDRLSTMSLGDVFARPSCTPRKGSRSIRCLPPTSTAESATVEAGAVALR
jgi:hypothetical protein